VDDLFSAPQVGDHPGVELAANEVCGCYRRCKVKHTTSWKRTANRVRSSLCRLPGSDENPGGLGAGLQLFTRTFAGSFCGAAKMSVYRSGVHARFRRWERRHRGLKPAYLSRLRAEGICGLYRRLPSCGPACSGGGSCRPQSHHRKKRSRELFSDFVPVLPQ